MQPVGHREWERPFPVRYLIVGEDEDGEELLLGRCAAVEGLFTDPAPPPREVLVLRGCAPGAAVGWLGPAEIVGRTASGFDAWWTLVDAEVLSVAPGADDPALVDVVIGAGVHPADWHRNADGPFVRFELVTRRGAVWATGRAVAGLAVDRPAADPLRLRLVGCEPAEPMRAALRKRRGPHPGYTELWSLDDTGRVMDRRAIGFDVEWTRPSVLGGALVDVLLTVEADGLPGSAARAVWRQWQAGPPRRAGSWRGFDAAGRHAWLMLALRSGRPLGPDRSGGEYHLPGRTCATRPVCIVRSARHCSAPAATTAGAWTPSPTACAAASGWSRRSPWSGTTSPPPRRSWPRTATRRPGSATRRSWPASWSGTG